MSTATVEQDVKPHKSTKDIDNLLRHISKVQDACTLLGRHLIEAGRENLGKEVIARGMRHDNSKFYGDEWIYLHAGKDVDKDKLFWTVRQHANTNDHHPEFWGGFNSMSEQAVAELSCDWLARSQEFGSSLRTWITDVAIDKYDIDTASDQYRWLQYFLDILLEDTFKR